MPSEAAPHGDATRQYLNTKVTGALLEGMKQLAKNQCAIIHSPTLEARPLTRLQTY
jgi:hypothetical protein